MRDGLLIVCGRHDFGQYLSNILSSAMGGRQIISLSGADARRKTSLSDFDAVLIAGKLADEGSILDLAYELAQGGTHGVMVVIDHSQVYEAHETLKGTDVTILTKPLTKEALINAIKLIEKVSEGGGIFDRAKLMLVQRKGWTEPQAHRYIQKLSMDKRLARDIAAQMVIKALEREQA